MEMVRVLFFFVAGTKRPQIKIRNDIRQKENNCIKSRRGRIYEKIYVDDLT